MEKFKLHRAITCLVFCSALSSSLFACSDTISGTPMGSAVTYAQVKAVFAKSIYSCASCHTGPTSNSVLNLPAGMDLTQTSANTVYTSLVNVFSLDVPSKKRVQPFSSSTSFLYEKVNCGSPTVGTQMPDGGPNYLTQNPADLQIVRDWINQGASSSYKVTASTTSPLAGNAVTITAQLQDMLGNAYGVANRTITWSSSNGGSFQNPTSTTNSSGVATIVFTPSTTAGTACKVTATDTVNVSPLVTVTGQSATITTQVGNISKYLVTSSSSSPVAGSTVTITAQEQDAFGNNRTDSGATITWSSAGGGTFSPSNTSGVTNGVATIMFVTGKVSGSSYTVTANDGAHSGTTGTITTIPGSATKYLVTPSTTTPNAGLIITVTAQLADANSNSVASSGIVVTWTSSGSGGSFASGNTSTTDSNGTATINFTTSTLAGTIHTVTATSNLGTLTGTSSNITTQAGTGVAYSVTVTTGGYNPVAGTPVTLTAQLLDSLNNPVHTSGLIITWTSTNGGSFSPSTSTTGVNGSATTSFTTSTVAGTVHDVTATDNNAARGTSADITTKAGSAARYLVTSDNYTVSAGTNVNISAQLADVNNNPVNTAGLTVSFTSTNGGTFTSMKQTDSSGIATAVFTVSTTAGTTHAITAKDSNNLSGTSSIITVTPGSASKYIVASNNYAPVAGSAVTITAQLADTFGNAVKTSSVTVNWSSSNGGTFFSSSSITDGNGIASVSFTTTQTAATTFVITAKDLNNLTGFTSNITSISGAAAKFLVSLSTSSPIAGSAITVTAKLADSNGNPVTTSGVSVFWSSSNGGTFSTASGTTNSNGIASVSYTTPATVNSSTVAASNNAGISGISPTIVSVAGPPFIYVVSAGTTSIAAGASINVTAQLADANGNSVASSGVNVTWKSTGGGSFSAPTTSTNAGGSASVSFTAASTTGNTYTIIAADNSLRTGKSSSITAVPNAPAKFLVSAASASVVAGSPVVITAQLADTFGNPVAQSGDSVIWTKSGTGGSLSAINSTTSADGTATITLITSKVAGIIHTVSAQDNSGSAGTSGLVGTIAGPAAQFAVTASNYSPVVGSSITLSAQYLDVQGNAVKTSGSLVNWSAVGAGTFSSNTSVTDTNGLTKIQFTVDSKIGTSVITATAAGINGTSAPIISIAGAPMQILLNASNASPPAGSVITVSAQLADSYGNPAGVSGVSVNWNASGNIGGTFTSSTSSTDSTGLASVQFITGTLAGAYTITANAGTGIRVSSVTVTSPSNTGVPIISSPLALTSPAGTQVSYEISANGANPFTVFATGLPPGISLSGNTLIGTPSVSGIFMVNLTLVNSVGTNTETLVLSVNGTGNIGSGFSPDGSFSPDDSDGDGVPDVLEVLAGTNPNDPADKPILEGSLHVDQIQMKLNFGSNAKDGMNAIIRLALPRGYMYADSSISAQFGGFSRTNISIGPTGSGSDSNTKVNVRPVVQGAQIALIGFSFKNLDLQTGLSAVGITNNDIKAGILSIPVAVVVKTGAIPYVYTGTVQVIYNAKMNKSGSAVILR